MCCFGTNSISLMDNRESYDEAIQLKYKKTTPQKGESDTSGL